VLVIDDEPIVRRTAKSMLERYGYAVLLAENGKEAADLFRVASERIALVILDMTMPVITLSYLKLINQRIPVILSSGSNAAEALRRFAGKSLAGFLQKKYSAADVARHIKAILNDAQS
jgi:two-component system, cell cycle sensor histidine kinase and response regulator CckA